MGEKKTNALSKSMKLIYVYAMATGAIFTFMCYWDGIFMSYTGPGTFLAFALMTLAVLPTAFVYAEFSTMLPSTGSCLVFNTVGINKHAGFWSAWLIMCAWIAVPAAGVLGIIECTLNKWCITVSVTTLVRIICNKCMNHTFIFSNKQSIICTAFL